MQALNAQKKQAAIDEDYAAAAALKGRISDLEKRLATAKGAGLSRSTAYGMGRLNYSSPERWHRIQ